MVQEKKSNDKSVSRRNFIRNSALATAGFYIVPRHVLGGKGYVAPSDKLLIAGVGAGGKGGDDQQRRSIGRRVPLAMAGLIGAALGQPQDNLDEGASTA